MQYSSTVQSANARITYCKANEPKTVLPPMRHTTETRSIIRIANLFQEQVPSSISHNTRPIHMIQAKQIVIAARHGIQLII